MGLKVIVRLMLSRKWQWWLSTSNQEMEVDVQMFDGTLATIKTDGKNNEDEVPLPHDNNNQDDLPLL